MESLINFEMALLSNMINRDDFIEKLEDNLIDKDIIFDKGFYIEVYINYNGIYSESFDGYSIFRYIDEELTYEELLTIFNDGSLKNETLTINIIPSQDNDYKPERDLAMPISIDVKKMIVLNTER